MLVFLIVTFALRFESHAAFAISRMAFVALPAHLFHLFLIQNSRTVRCHAEEQIFVFLHFQLVLESFVFQEMFFRNISFKEFLFHLLATFNLRADESLELSLVNKRFQVHAKALSTKFMVAGKSESFFFFHGLVANFTAFIHFSQKRFSNRL